jgi:hypothetical protein
MAWFEDGLQVQKAKEEEEKYKNDTRRWLNDADRDILEDLNGGAELANKFKVRTSVRQGTLHITIGNVEAAHYRAKDEGVEYQPVSPEFAEKTPPTVLTSEADFKEHLCKFVWAFATYY